jgi:acyl-CoA hydrolase
MDKDERPLISPEQSASQATQLMMPGDVNNLGHVFGGVLISLVDRAAAVTAMRHARGPCVTVSIDKVDFKEPIYSGELVTCSARINFIGKTSMEIGVTVVTEHPMTGVKRHTNDCFLTFVAVNKDGRPVRVPGLELSTEEDKKRFAEGQRRRQARQELADELGLAKQC